MYYTIFQGPLHVKIIIVNYEFYGYWIFCFFFFKKAVIVDVSMVYPSNLFNL